MTEEKLKARLYSQIYGFLIGENLVSRLVALLAIGLMLALVRKAWLDMDLSWDATAYHLPFAALRTGIFSHQQYHLSKLIQTYYDGFPVLPDYVKGCLWKLTSRPQAANLIGLAGILTAAYTLTTLFKVPVHYTLLSFLSVPSVLIEAISCYNDLFANCAMLVMLLLILHVLLNPQKLSLQKVSISLLAFSVASNFKLQFVLVGTGSLLFFLCLIYLYRHQSERLQQQWSQLSLTSKSALLFIYVVLILSAYSNEIKNTVLFHNPLYPVSFTIGRLRLPGMRPETYGFNAYPAYWSGRSQILKWILSVAEYRAFEGRNPLWTNGQGDVPLSSPASHMGGYFSALVVFNLIWAAVLLRKNEVHSRTKIIGLFSALTLCTAVLPASHELRYFSFWILGIISANLIMLFGIEHDKRFDLEALYMGAAVSFLFFVLSSDGFAYLQRDNFRPKVLVKRFGIEQQLKGLPLHTDERVCALGKDRLTFFYAPYFNKQLEALYHYQVQEAYAADDCQGARILP